jgi:putative acetyltransferase
MREASAGLTIRPYEPSDHAAVRALVVDINRELAPAAMREAFEKYIARSLREEIDRIPEYYAGRGGGFFVALEGDTLVGVFGLEGLNTAAAELRRMYVRRDRRRSGIAAHMLRWAEALCRDAGCRRLTLSTSELQQAALVPRHRGFDWLIFGHFRMGRCSGATSSSMLRATPGWRRIRPARSRVRTI